MKAKRTARIGHFCLPAALAALATLYGCSTAGIGRAPDSSRLVVTTVSAPPDSDDKVRTSERLALAMGEKEIAWYNPLLASLNIPNLEQQIHVELTYDPHPGGLTGGDTESDRYVRVTYSQTPFDVSILARELGHVIQKSIGPPDDQIVIDPNHSTDATIINEGIANLLAAFYLGSPKVGGGEFFQAAYDVDLCVYSGRAAPQTARSGRCMPASDLTYAYWFNQLLASPNYVSHEPDAAAQLRQLLATTSNPYLWLPQTDLVSASFTQPLWQLGQKHGMTAAARILLETISEFKDFSSVGNFASALVESARALHEDPNAIEELRRDLAARGFKM